MKCSKCGENYGGWSNQISGPFGCFCIRKIKAAKRLERDHQKLTNGCWEFTGPRLYSGYGDMKLMFQGKFIRPVHRIAWILVNGPIPEGLTVEHKCRNRACINVAHMELVTLQENIARKPRPTHCPQGHEYTPENSVYFPSEPTHRRCRICHNSQSNQCRRTQPSSTWARS